MKFFGINIHRNYALWILWAFIATVAYLLSSLYPDNAYLEQFAIKTRNLGLLALGLYTFYKYFLVKIPMQTELVEALKDKTSPNYGQALRTAGLLTAAAIYAAATVLVGAQ